MQPSQDYPRMMFHRSREPVTVFSREEEDGLGPEWSRIIWPVLAISEPEHAPAPEPEPQAAGYAAEEPEEDSAPLAPTRPARTPSKPPAKKRR